jgi:Rrf2 family iron-sulfur cluster assembly transcriptional regulator
LGKVVLKKFLDKIFLLIYRIKIILFILFTECPVRLTRAGEYAVRCILYLSGQERGLVVPRRRIAQAMEIPEQFLGKIAQQLARAGILQIVQGARGGYRLAMVPDQVTLLQVVEAAVGEIFLNDCLLRPNSCWRSETCSVNEVWQKARRQLRETLGEVTFADLLEERSCIEPLLPAGERQDEGR